MPLNDRFRRIDFGKETNLLQTEFSPSRSEELEDFLTFIMFLIVCLVACLPISLIPLFVKVGLDSY